MIKVMFILKTSKTNQKGESPIFAKLSYKGVKTELATGKSLSKQRWEATAHLTAVLKSEKEKVIQKALEALELSVEKKFSEYIRTGREFSLSELKDAVMGRDRSEKITVLSVVDLHNRFFEKKVSAGERSAASLQKYRRARDLMAAYIKKNHPASDLYVEAIGSAFVYGLEEYLRYESAYKDNTGIQNNAVVKYMRMYKTAFKYALTMERIDKNPFNIYRGSIKTDQAVFLTAAELLRIENKKFDTKRLDRVRDIFLFSCYTGYAPVDALRLTADNLTEGQDGMLWIVTSRTKTAIKANVPVLPPVLSIVRKYQGQQEGLLPGLSNQKMNAYLKEIAVLCHISKKLTWYVARHTFATTVTLGNGMKIENVSAMMGHTNIRQTQHYAKVLDQNILQDMARLMDKWK